MKRMRLKITNTRLLLLLLMITLSLIISSCEKQNKISADMITARSMGLAYLEENKLVEAEAAFKKLIEIAPDEPLAFANLGLVYTRMGDYEKAETYFESALELAPNDPEIQFNLTELLILTNRGDKAIEILEETLRFNPDHIKTLYKLGKIYSNSDDVTISQKCSEYLTKVVDFLPTNLTAQLDLIEILLHQNKADMAASHMEKLNKIMPEFPKEAEVFYSTSLQNMLNDKVAESIPPFNIFRNILKPTILYRAGADELKGISGPLIGTPLITFSGDNNLSGQSTQMVLEAIRFTDVTEAAGLSALPELKSSSYILAAADLDGNGTQDLYASVWDKEENENNAFLLNNDFGKFVDISAAAGIKHNGIDRDAIFTDYDNDGFLDLFITNGSENILYYHFEEQKFRNVTTEAGIGGDGSGNSACFADFDHDGDLDLYLANQSQNDFFRNNLDGSFTENSKKMGIRGDETPSRKVAFGDFDDDGDIDLFVLNSETSNILYSNLRQGEFADVTSKWGLKSDAGSNSLAIGDYNNDGLLDILITNSNPSGYTLYYKFDGEQYEKDNRSNELETILKEYICQDAKFFDFDNDGYLDLVFAGKSKRKDLEMPGLLLFHNNGKGVFKDVSNLLPELMPAGSSIEIADYNEDGDQDIFFSGEDGRVRLLRNDGGNANHYLKVQLVGLRTGSGKNNYFGIGAKVELKAGELYQSQVVTKPVIHFGMGQKTKADIVRVLWTNGVPQNLFEPGSDQEILEEQILKGSCPFIYAWNGDKYEFVTDVLWRSAIGMPLGIMGGETAYAFSDPAEDYFKIHGEMLKKKDDNYSLKLTAELWETAYFDQVKLLVVDHPETSDIYLDERFTPPPFPPLKFYQVSEKKYPKSIIDDRGNDLSEITRSHDDIYVSDLNPQKYQGITKLHDIIMDLGDLSGEKEIVLYLNGWVFPTDASINMAVSQSSENLIHPPSLQVKEKNGRWKTVIENFFFPMGKNKTVILDLSDKFLSDNYQVRIRTGMQIYWDHIFYSLSESEIPLRVNNLTPSFADLHYRGFSRMYRKGGRYGPFWFEYNDVSEDPKWRDLEGTYTRYGDVNDLLLEADSKYIITNAGDEISLEFNAEEVPDLPEGWSRDFVIYTNGWLKDGDLNTSKGQTVEPLPFKGMSKYPYGENEHYPRDTEHQQFLKKYITRKVTTDNYKKLLIPVQN